MQLSDAIATLMSRTATGETLSDAFIRACASRERWPVSDLVGYRDVYRSGEVVLPSPTDFQVNVDLITKPKQAGGLRVERLPDILTSTLLEMVANKLAQAEPSSHSHG